VARNDLRPRAPTSSTANWTGLFTTKINPPKNEAELRANPLGVFITTFQWSREL
jgi:type IV secretory pathway TrbF-like protein